MSKKSVSNSLFKFELSYDIKTYILSYGYNLITFNNIPMCIPCPFSFELTDFFFKYQFVGTLPALYIETMCRNNRNCLVA